MDLAGAQSMGHALAGWQGGKLGTYRAKYLADWTTGEGVISYDLFLQQKEFERSHLEAAEAQTLALVGSQERTAEVIRQGLSEGFDGLNQSVSNLQSGLENLRDDLTSSVETQTRQVTTALYWGFSKLIEGQECMQQSIEDLVALARTPSQTWALEQFEIARSNESRKLFPEALESVQRAIGGFAANTGNKTEFRFHLLLGKLRLGNFENNSADIVDPPAAEAAFLDAARYARHESPRDCGAALICAGRAAYVQREFLRGIEHTQAGLAIVPKHAHGQYQLARLLCAAGKPDSARTPLALAIRHMPDLSNLAAREPEFLPHQPMVRAAMTDAQAMLVRVFEHKRLEFRTALSQLEALTCLDRQLARVSPDKLQELDRIEAEAVRAIETGTVLGADHAIRRLMSSSGEFAKAADAFKNDLTQAVATEEEKATQQVNASADAIRRRGRATAEGTDARRRSRVIAAFVVAAAAIAIGLALRNAASLPVAAAGLFIANWVYKSRPSSYGIQDAAEKQAQQELANLYQIRSDYARRRTTVNSLRWPYDVPTFSAFSDDPPAALPSPAAKASRTAIGRESDPLASLPAGDFLIGSRNPHKRQTRNAAPIVLGVVFLSAAAAAAIWYLDPAGWRGTGKQVAGFPDPETTPPAVDPEAAREERLWAAVAETQSRRSLENYLREFPEGRYADDARISLAGMGPAPILPQTGWRVTSGGERFFVEPYTPASRVSVQATGARFRIYPWANEDTDVVAVASDGQTLDVVGVAIQPDGTWYQVTLAGVEIAYIRSDLTSLPAPLAASESATDVMPATPDAAAAPVVTPNYERKPKRKPGGRLPDYPAGSRAAREEGTTTLTLCVSANGTVSRSEISSSSGYPRLDDAALRWTQAQEFEPATAGNLPAEFCGYTLDYQWKLDN